MASLSNRQCGGDSSTSSFSFRFDDLPSELRQRIYEHVFMSGWKPASIEIRSLHERKPAYRRLPDTYHDTFYDCTINGELFLHLDSRFRQLFVSQDFLSDALPIFASQNRLEIQMRSHRTMTDLPKSDIVQRTLLQILRYARSITITHSILARDNYLCVDRLLPLISISRLKECNLVIDKPRFWMPRYPDLRTSIVGDLFKFAFRNSDGLRVLTKKEVESLKRDKQPPEGLRELLGGQNAPLEVEWHCKKLVPLLQQHRYAGDAFFQIEIVAVRGWPPQPHVVPSSCY